jgi:hypothetical protein
MSDQLIIPMKIDKLHSYFIPYTETSSRWVDDPQVKSKTSSSKMTQESIFIILVELDKDIL